MIHLHFTVLDRYSHSHDQCVTFCPSSRKPTWFELDQIFCCVLLSNTLISSEKGIRQFVHLRWAKS